jgi:hypothetical protein
MDRLFVACERANRNVIFEAICENKSQMAVLRNIKDRYAGKGKAYEFVLRKARELKVSLTRSEMVYLAGTIWLEAWH